MATTGHYNAMRFAQNPLPQPCYNFNNVPKAARDLQGSLLQRVHDRENLKTCMAEMLLLCKEAMRRRPGAGGNGSKPLSLEYLADRLDVDDPCFGYMVRTNENLQMAANWQRGMLQGFITVTTFTNWQRTFQWDSANEVAFSYDDETLDLQRVTGERVWDTDGNLAREMQATVRCGDIWNEGVVWPRIAEISLLGGLGCGKPLVSLVIEELERMKASGKHNYDYITLQATDNSIPFYESMGFVRVGALVLDETTQTRGRSGSTSSGTDEEVAEAEPVEAGSPEKTNAIASCYDIVTGPLSSYAVKKAGETPSEIAKKLDVDVNDIIFLNKDIYTDLGSGSRCLAGTVLHVPVNAKPKAEQPGAPLQVKTRKAEAELPRWYVAKENETPRLIAKKCQVKCLDLIEANKARLPGLVSNSRLKHGTKVKVSHFDVHDEEFKPYAHWTFPDDRFEDGEPSYMMALKLNRCRGAAAKYFPFREALAVPVSQYEPTDLLLPPSPVRMMSPASMAAASSNKRSKPLHPDEPRPPKRPLGPYMLFAIVQREQNGDLVGLSIGDSSKIISEHWKALPALSKSKYDIAAEKARAKYRIEKANHDTERAVFDAKHQTPAAPSTLSSALEASAMKVDLFNKVVRLKPGAMTESSEFKYWFVLTFIPDLKWCHLAPMVQIGTFGPDKHKAEGRPKWKLVDESLGKEVDISSSYCIPIKSRSMKRTQDADKEEWDIIDDGTFPVAKTKSASRSYGKQTSSYDSDFAESERSVRTKMSGAAIKPSAVERKRRRSDLESDSDTPSLMAILPGSRWPIYVRLSGMCLEDDDVEFASKRGRGRPKGSRNKTKPPSDDLESPKKEPGRVRKSEVSFQPPPDLSFAADTDPSKKGRGRLRNSDISTKSAPAAKRGRFVTAKPPPVASLARHTGPPKRGRPKGAKDKVTRKRRTDQSANTAQDCRPKRSAAPEYLGESPMTPHSSGTWSRGSRSSSARSGFVRDISARTGSPARPRRIAASIGANAFTSPIRRISPQRAPRSSGVSSCRAQMTSPFLTSPARRNRSPARSSGGVQCLPAAMSPLIRPKRSAAPSFLGESPLRRSPHSSSTPTRSNVGETPLTSQAFSVENIRPKRKAAPSFLGESVERKRRQVNSSGWSVLQD